MIDEHAILKWAAGAAIELPRLDDVNDERILWLLGIDEERLHFLLEEHRLPHRFLHRAAQERPGWCPQHLLAAVAHRCAQIEARVRAQMAAVREIEAAIAGPDRPVIAVKGYMAYALTHDGRLLRFSADLDLFADDPEALYLAVRRLGYAGEKIYQHELARMRRGDLTVEIHDQFPVCSYPPEVAAADLAPERHPGLWVQTMPELPERDNLPLIHHTRREIRYADLLERATDATAPEAAGLTLPDPAMAAFILCAHEFRDFIEPSFRRSLAVRLGALADIADLARHPQFDRARFAELVERFRGHDSVRFVGQLMASFLGKDPLPVSAPSQAGRPPRTDHRPPPGENRPDQGRAHRSVVGRRWSVAGPACLRLLLSPWRRAAADWVPGPRALSYHGGWASICSAEDLLAPVALSALVERLGANHLIAGTAACPDRHANSGIGASHRLDRLILHSRGAPAPPFLLSATWGADALALDVTIVAPLDAGQRYHLRLRAGEVDVIHHWAEIGHDGSLLGQGAEAGPGEAAASELDGGYACRFSFPWVDLPRSLRARRSLPVLLHLMRCCGTGSGRPEKVDPVIIAPIVIARERPVATPGAVSGAPAREHKGHEEYDGHEADRASARAMDRRDTVRHS